MKVGGGVARTGGLQVPRAGKSSLVMSALDELVFSFSDLGLKV